MGTGIGPGAQAGSWRITALARATMVPLEVMIFSQPRVVAASPWELTYAVSVPSPQLILSMPRPP